MQEHAGADEAEALAAAEAEAKEAAQGAPLAATGERISYSCARVSALVSTGLQGFIAPRRIFLGQATPSPGMWYTYLACGGSAPSIQSSSKSS